ncbi:MAG: hypothetical protein [Bacteriophage sp.]|nr:MAG: hypothetical protein [Bacteriophage sp.]
MFNLIEGIKYAMQECNKTPEDIDWVGNYNGTLVLDWGDFVEHCDVDFDGWVRDQIPPDLIVKFCDGSWLEREGSGCWYFRKSPEKCVANSPFRFKKCVNEEGEEICVWKEI